MLQLLVAGLGLLLIFEGVLPFLAPRFWRRMMQQLIMQSDRFLQIFGLISMLAGLGLLYLIR